MSSEPLIVFPPFRLDVRNEQLWRDEALVPLRPKPFAVLAYLALHPGQLVTAVELRKAVWPNTYVGEGLLRGYIREVRRVLGDDPAHPEFIETLPRRGYRFLAEVIRGQPSVASSSPTVGVSGQSPMANSPPLLTQFSALSPQHSLLVGRERELTQLQGWLTQALAGQRQLVFITGEPGIGKTTLIDAFLHSLAPSVPGKEKHKPRSLTPYDSAVPPPHALLSSQRFWIGRGQCIEHYGSGEAYLPVLEALGQLCRQPDGAHLIEILQRHAPSWLVQMPALVTDAEFDRLKHKVQGAARERMLRELAEAIEAFTADHVLILAFEDLHWCDYSTLDLLGVLAHRREPARLFVIGSYRPADVIVSNHPLRGLKQELQSRQQCHELALGFLTEQSVIAYLAERFARGATNDTKALQELARVIHQQSDGNPLFMVGLINYWMQEGALPGADEQQQLDEIAKHTQHGIPDGLRQMVERQLDRLSDEEQQLLEVASVAGEEFLAAAVSIGNTAWKEVSEERYEELAAHGQFVRFRQLETLPDGSVTGRYRFLHALYQKIVYERLTTVRRTRLHRALGERLEQLWSAQAPERAMELALHFERGQESQRAVQYLWQAAENARGKHAYQETVAILRKGVDLLKTQPDTVERVQQELALLVMLGVPLLMTKGYAASEVEQTYARAHQLCQNVGNSPQLLPALAGLFRFYFVRAKFSLAHEFAEQALSLAQETSDRTVFLIAHCLLATLSTTRGRFLTAREHFDEGLRLYDPHQHPVMASIYGDDPGVICRSLGGFNLWFLGYPDQALQNAQAGMVLAQSLAHPYNLAFALDIATWIHFYRGEPQAAKTCLDSLLPLVHEQGFEFFAAESMVLQGWAMTEQEKGDEGLAQMHAGVDAYHATGAKMSRPTHLGLLAKTYGKAGRIQEGLASMAEAFAALEETKECCLEAELWRLHGELILQKGKEERQKGKGKNGKLKGNRTA